MLVQRLRRLTSAPRANSWLDSRRAASGSPERKTRCYYSNSHMLQGALTSLIMTGKYTTVVLLKGLKVIKLEQPWCCSEQLQKNVTFREWVWIGSQVKTPAGIATYPLRERLLCSSSGAGSCPSGHHDRWCGNLASKSASDIDSWTDLKEGLSMYEWRRASGTPLITNAD